MPFVRFTKEVDDTFGGYYSKAGFTVRAGDVLNVTEAVFSSIMHDHPDLIEEADDPKGAKPGKQKGAKGKKAPPGVKTVIDTDTPGVVDK